MKLRNLFKPKWQYGSHSRRLKAVSRITNPKTLRKIIDHSNDERLCFEAASLLNDVQLIRRMARSAVQEVVRLKAAIYVKSQSDLTSIALNAWDIHVGQKAVAHIQNELLLRRVAHSAKQDAIRLAAALKVSDEQVLRKVARSSNHIDVHWQVAQRLDDPRLLAEVIMFKPANMRLEPLRRKARRTLTDHLNRCRERNDHRGLETAFTAVPHPAFKLEAFVRFQPDRITPSMLDHLATLDFRYIPRNLLDQMLDHIKRCGWQVSLSLSRTPCVYCTGKGELSLKYLSANNNWVDHDVFPCPDCQGQGSIPFRSVSCMKGHQIIRLKLPV